MQNIHLPGADVRLQRELLARPQADRLLASLLAGIPWRQGHIDFGHGPIAEPRLTSWHGDAGGYVYSGKRMQAEPWTPDLEEIRDAVEAAIADAGMLTHDGRPVRFNSVLLNRYRGNRDSIGYHADNEPEFGRDPVIASVSLGHERTFVLVPKPGREGARTALPLPHGSLLVMAGACQRNWKHGIDKERVTHSRERINLTFRTIVAR